MDPESIKQKERMVSDYFPTAKSEQDLNSQQLELYKSLRTLGGKRSPELHARITAIKQFVGPVTSGEIIAAEEELMEDAFVSWVLANEDPQRVTWVELKK